jgi:hypothetical protein
MEPTYFTWRQKHEFGAMDPNIKLVLDKMAKLRADIKEGFTVQDTTFSKHFEEVMAVDQHYDARVTSLEEVAEMFTNTLAAWRPEVDTSIKLKLAKLNKFFDRDAKASVSTQSSVLPLESAAATTSPTDQADDSNEHRVHHNNQDCGFGCVNTQVQDPVTGTISSPLPSPQSPIHSRLLLGSDGASFYANPNPSTRSSLGRLPLAQQITAQNNAKQCLSFTSDSRPVYSQTSKGNDERKIIAANENMMCLHLSACVLSLYDPCFFYI